MKSKRIPVLLLIIGLGFLGCRDVAVASDKIANTAGKKLPVAPPWELKDLNGRSVKSSDFKGKVVMLNFWATWCPPCREEIPALIALQNQYKDKGLVVVGVSLDQNGPATVKAFVARMKVHYPVVMGDDKIAAAYGGVSIIPTTYLIDRQSNIAGGVEGGADQATLESAIAPLLGKPKSNL